MTVPSKDSFWTWIAVGFCVWIAVASVITVMIPKDVVSASSTQVFRIGDVRCITYPGPDWITCEDGRVYRLVQ